MKYKCQFCPTIVERNKRPKYGLATCPKCSRERKVQGTRERRARYKANRAPNSSPPPPPPPNRFERLIPLYQERTRLEVQAGTTPLQWRELKVKLEAEGAYATAELCSRRVKELT